MINKSKHVSGAASYGLGCCVVGSNCLPCCVASFGPKSDFDFSSASPGLPQAEVRDLARGSVCVSLTGKPVTMPRLSSESAWGKAKGVVVSDRGTTEPEIGVGEKSDHTVSEGGDVFDHSRFCRVECNSQVCGVDRLILTRERISKDLFSRDWFQRLKKAPEQWTCIGPLWKHWLLKFLF